MSKTSPPRARKPRAAAARPRPQPHQPLNRIGELLAMNHMKPAELARAIGAQRSQIFKLQHGETQLTMAWMRRLATGLNCKPEDLMVDTGAVVAEFNGAVGAGDRIVQYEDRERSFEGIPAPPGMRPPVGCVVVRGISMEPAYRDGDLLFYEHTDGVPRHAIDRDAVVQLASGEMMVKVVKPGSGGRYNLLSYNRPDLILDQALIFAAPILWVRRG